MLARYRRSLACAALLGAAVAGSPAAAADPTGASAVPLPPAPSGTALVSRPKSWRDTRVGALAGMASPQGNGGDASLMLQGEVSVPWRSLPSGLAVGFAVPVRTILLSSEKIAGLESGGLALEVAPCARISFPLRGTKLSARADVGIGAVARWTWTQVDVTYLGRTTTTDRSTTGVVRFGLALDYRLLPNVSIAFEPISMGYDLDGNADWIFAAGASFRL